MSPTQPPPRKMTVPRFVRSAEEGSRLTMLTAYDYTWARLMDSAGIDSILVGDSLGMTVQGHNSTLPVTLEQMIYHGEMVVRAVKRALVIVDMPFLTCSVSIEEAIRNAGTVLQKTGADAVKVEGGCSMAPTVSAMINAGIPVMGHIGMQPQSVRVAGSMGKIQREESRLLEEANAMQSAGAFGVVLELVPGDIAQRITEATEIPTIGIGAGAGCNGQVLVGPDMLGLNPEFKPRFLKTYASLHSVATDAVQCYIQDVREGRFPGPEHTHS